MTANIPAQPESRRPFPGHDEPPFQTPFRIGAKDVAKAWLSFPVDDHIPEGRPIVSTVVALTETLGHTATFEPILLSEHDETDVATQA